MKSRAVVVDGIDPMLAVRVTKPLPSSLLARRQPGFLLMSSLLAAMPLLPTG